MALFKKSNDNSSRAVDIIKGIKPQGEPQDPPVDPPVDPQDPPQDPPADPQDPPADPPQDPPADPPVDPQDPPQDPPADPPVDPNADPNINTQDPADPEPQDPEPQDPSGVDSQITEESMFNFLSEKLNKPINSLDDLVTVPELDPELKQLKDWKDKTGLSLLKFSDYNRDFSKMADVDVAREILAQEYENLTSEELDFVMKDYVFNEDEDNESDKMAKGVKLKRFAADGRKQLESNRLNLVPSEGQGLTEEQQKDLQLAKQVKEQQEQQQTGAVQYKKSLEKAALSLKAVNMQLSDDLNINYDVAEGDRRSLPELVEKMPHWYNEDGTVNHESIVKDALIIREYPNMIKKAFEQGISVGTENKINKDKNLTLDPGKEPVRGQGTPKKGNINDVVDGITGGTKRQKRFKFKPQKE